MTYKFDANLDDILKIVYSEKKRIYGQKDSFANSVRRLDQLKVKTNAPVSTSAELWNKKVGDLLNGKSGLNSIIRLENAYIKANQYIDFAKGTIDELYGVGAQLLVLLRHYRNEKLLPDEQAISLPIGIEDCNEMMRYITVWDIHDYVLKPNEKYLMDTVILKEFDNPLLMYTLCEMGYGDYVNALIKEYKSKLKEADDIKDKVLQVDNQIFDNLSYLNKIAKFKAQVPYNLHDGSRSPIGCDNELKSNQMYTMVLNEYLKEYKKQNIVNKDKDLGR